VLDPMHPVFSLEGGILSETKKATTGKKNRKKKVPKKPSSSRSIAAEESAPPMGHLAPVMTLNVHPEEQHLLASGSADKTVKIWDLNRRAVVHSFDHHTDKVQCVRWNKYEPSVLLTASYDKKMCLLDVRKCAKSVASLELSADAEQAVWSREDTNICYVSTEDGKVVCYDARMIAQGTSTLPLFNLSAYDSKVACSGLAQHSNVLVTGGMDGVAKVWDLRKLVAGNTQCETEKSLGIGSLYAVSGAQHCSNEGTMFLFGGSAVGLWDLASEQKLCETFSWTWDASF